MALLTDLRLVLIIVGVLMLFLTFVEYARKDLTETMSSIWGIFNIALIVVALFNPIWWWANRGGTRIYLLIFLVFLVLIGAVFALSITLSHQMMKDREIAIQVSLLIQENEQFRTQLRALEQRVQLSAEQENEEHLQAEQAADKTSLFPTKEGA
ncbi:hypothetical protein FACS1894111_06750 [Clostridia bacterium]|nr:hypothetical protein FACS1894111_06750 [Clostridia bacterium]